MKGKFLRVFFMIVAALALLCALSACGGGDAADEAAFQPATDLENRYNDDIAYQFRMASDKECPDGAIKDEFLYEKLTCEAEETYYLVLDICVLNFDRMKADGISDTFDVVVTISGAGLFATLEYANTSMFSEFEEVDYIEITTTFTVPSDSHKESAQRIIYRVKSKGHAIAYGLEIDGVEGEQCVFSGGAKFCFVYGPEYSGYDGYEFATFEENGATDICIPLEFRRKSINWPEADEDSWWMTGGIFQVQTVRTVAMPQWDGNLPSLETVEEVIVGVTHSFYNEEIDPYTQDGVLYRKVHDDSDWDSYKVEIDFVPRAIKGEVRLSDGITSIDDNQFQDRKGLTAVVIPDSVTKIGRNAFSGCDMLESVTIGRGVSSIDQYAFAECGSLMNVVIPDSVTGIGGHVFEGTGLYQDASYWDESGVLYLGRHLIAARDTITGVCNVRADTIEIVDDAFEGCESLTGVVIPEGMISIGDRAFQNCTALTKIVIPEGMISIGNWAFQNCTALTKIVIPEGMVSIGTGAFEDCSALADIDLADGLLQIGDSAFKGTACYNHSANWDTQETGPDPGIKKVVFYIGNYLIETNQILEKGYYIREGTKYIRQNAFYGCEKLTWVSLPDSVVAIGASAFYGCSGLETVYLGDGVETIGNSAFENCTRLGSVQQGSHVTEIGDSAFSGCVMLHDFNLPQGLLTIGNRAFFDCDHWKQPRIPDSVQSIGDEAFRHCFMQSVVIGSGVTSIGESVLLECNQIESIYYHGTQEQ